MLRKDRELKWAIGKRIRVITTEGEFRGILVDFSGERDSFIFENLIYSGGQNGFSMPIYGTMCGENILGAVVKTPFDCLLRAEINSGTPKAYAVTPCWLFEGGRLMGPRRVDCSAFRGGYVDLARWYR